jgi:predicted nucleic acid-binding Zn ribbon protein
MVCVRCGTQVASGSKFCPKCGDVIQSIRQRHGFTSVWLIFSLIGFAFSGIQYLLLLHIPGDFFQMIREAINISDEFIILLGIISLAGIAADVLLLKWKKIGFWILCGVSVVSFVVNMIALKENILLNFLGLLGIAVMWGVLHISKDGKNTWEQLE